MQAIYHLSSSQEITFDLLESIRNTFKSKPITIVVDEEIEDYEISEDLKSILNDRLAEDESDYISADESIKQLKNKYGL
jgi:hypothetical protein